MQVKEKSVTQIEDNLKKLQEDTKSIAERLSRFKESKGKEITEFINKHRQESESLTFFINNKKQEIENYLTDTKRELSLLIKTSVDEIKNESEIFKSQIKNIVDTNRQNIDKEISDFLYKQNALVSNLNQQIDSYHKLTETLKGRIEEQGDEIKRLRNISEEYQKQIESLKAQDIDINSKLNEIVNELKRPLLKKLFSGK